MKIEDSVENIESSIFALNSDISTVSDCEVDTSDTLSNLETRVAELMAMKGINTSTTISSYSGKEEKIETPSNGHLSNSDIDTIVACVAGGIGVLVDFLLVKIPKTTTIVRNGESITQTGSPMTNVLRKIGFDSNGKTSGWVKTLEGYFGVNYDTSIISGEPGFYPKSHRLYSLAHDPSPSGLLWALKDAVCGTMSYIAKDGTLRIYPTKDVAIWRILATPIIWLGHIISDIFTKAGIPIPGSCFLRTLQFGSIGEKGRTIGQVVEYMYLNGYDLRHMMTMGVENAVIELIVRVYHALTKPAVERFARPQALIQADIEMINRRLQDMRLKAYAVAACGNIAKLAVYEWNPLALNATIWMEFARTAIVEYERRHGITQMALDAIAERASINETFDNIEKKLT